jgi:hypothetical protein
MSERMCSVGGCERSHYGRGWCRPHYYRWRRTGEIPVGPIAATLTFSSQEERFWSKVDKTGDCWMWMAGRTNLGYGEFHLRSKTVYAHRHAWELANGAKVPPGMFVCHSCDVHACVNPAHLWIGTPQDNTQDMIGKGRRVAAVPKGEACHAARLTEAQVRVIRAEYAAGETTQRALARRYGVADSRIFDIVHRHAWAWLD